MALARSLSQLWRNHFHCHPARLRLRWPVWKVKALQCRGSLRRTVRGRPRPHSPMSLLARTPAFRNGARAGYSHAFTATHSIACAKKSNPSRLLTLCAFFLSGRKSRPITKSKDHKVWPRFLINSKALKRRPARGNPRFCRPVSVTMILPGLMRFVFPEGLPGSVYHHQGSPRKDRKSTRLNSSHV